MKFARWQWALLAMAAAVFFSGCATVPTNTVLLREGQTNLMREVMRCNDRIVELSRPESDANQPALLLLHGATPDPSEMLDIATEWRGKYHVFLYSFNRHYRVETLARDLNSEIMRLRRERRLQGSLTVIVYSYSAILFRAAVEAAQDPALFSDTSLIQLVPTAGGSFLARSMNFPVAVWLVSLASKPSRASNPYGHFARDLWEGEGNRRFYEAIPPSRVRTILVEGDPHSLSRSKNQRVLQHYQNGIGPNVVVIPKSTGINHDYLPTQSAALEYLRQTLELTRTDRISASQSGAGQGQSHRVSPVGSPAGETRATPAPGVR
jgi:hypothetical protein